MDLAARETPKDNPMENPNETPEDDLKDNPKENIVFDPQIGFSTKVVRGCVPDVQTYFQDLDLPICQRPWHKLAAAACQIFKQIFRMLTCPKSPRNSMGNSLGT